MGWANCGEDSKGRKIGYAIEAFCDHPGCTETIDRGLSYACGGMHGVGPDGACEGYFCGNHLRGVHVEDDLPMMCFSCAEAIEKEAKEFPNVEEDEYEELDKIQSEAKAIGSENDETDSDVEAT